MPASPYQDGFHPITVTMAIDRHICHHAVQFQVGESHSIGPMNSHPKHKEEVL